MAIKIGKWVLYLGSGIFSIVVLGGTIMWIHHVLNGMGTDGVVRAVGILSSASCGIMLVGFMIILLDIGRGDGNIG